MSDNPLETTPEREHEIEARAKSLMEEAGGAGAIEDFRERADELIRMEHAGNPGQLPNPMNHPEIIEEASIQENLGEFPGARSAADQGERRETPMTREELHHTTEELTTFPPPFQGGAEPAKVPWTYLGPWNAGGGRGRVRRGRTHAAKRATAPRKAA